MEKEERVTQRDLLEGLRAVNRKMQAVGRPRSVEECKEAYIEGRLDELELEECIESKLPSFR